MIFGYHPNKHRLVMDGIGNVTLNIYIFKRWVLQWLGTFSASRDISHFRKGGIVCISWEIIFRPVSIRSFRHFKLRFIFFFILRRCEILHSTVTEHRYRIGFNSLAYIFSISNFPEIDLITFYFWRQNNSKQIITNLLGGRGVTW